MKNKHNLQLLFDNRWCWSILLSIEGGNIRFNKIQSNLMISRAVLSRKLLLLIQLQLVEKTIFNGIDGYRLTKKGESIVYHFKKFINEVCKII